MASEEPRACPVAASRSALLVAVVLLLLVVPPQIRAAPVAAVWPEADTQYELLGKATCQGDELYRPVAALCASVPGGNATQAATQCFALCDLLFDGMSRCMGVEVTQDGSCCLLDRDWSRAERSHASDVLSGAPLDASELFQRYGSHLVRAEDDPRRLASITVPTACYRRRVDCSSAPNCTALNRYPCEWGKIANTCDRCRPRYWTPMEPRGVASNSACVPDPAATPPTLRIAFSTACLLSDSQDSKEGLNAGYIGAAFALKHAWETEGKVIPIPLEERENFTIELVGFTENWTMVQTFAGGGTGEASPTSVMPGLMAMSGAANNVLQTSLQLRQTSPPGKEVHAVIGNLKSQDAEVELANAGQAHHTPVIGWAWTDPSFADYSYYVRSNRVALDAGLAIAAVFQHLGYTRIFVFEQLAAPRLASQIRTAHPLATVVTDGPDQSVRGPCDGSQGKCIQEAIHAWVRLRAQDARVIAHEHGGAVFESVLPLATDILGPKVLYIMNGLSCTTPMALMDGIASSQQSSRGLDTFYDTASWQGPRCVICSNIAYSYLDSDVLINKTYVAEWLYDTPDPDVEALRLSWCPQFPNKRSFLDCDYCDTNMSFFASPACWDLTDEFERVYAHSMCVEADFSHDTLVTDAIIDFFVTVGDEVPSGNDTEDGIRAAQRLRDSGMPESYLQSYEPGGHLWELGIETDGRPVTWSAQWDDGQLMNDMAKDTFGNFFVDNIVDTILTLIVGYNDFVKHGGDADDTSQAWRPSATNPISYGFLRHLLGVRFTGQSGLVEYRLTGSRNVLYNVYQMVRGNREGGCYAEAVLHNSTAGADAVRKARGLHATWNFQSANVSFNLSGQLALDDSNILGCSAFQPGYFAGKIALIRRGSCEFGTKALMAGAAGAIAAVIWNQANELPFWMDGSDRALTTPAMMIGRTDGHALAEALRAGLAIHVTLRGSTRCWDPTDPGSGGLELFEYSMTFNPNTGSLVIASPTLTYNDGTTTPPLQARLPCAPGAAYNLSSRECEPCEPGNYLPSSTALTCLPCPAGAFSSGYGGTSCQLCGINHFSNASSSKCEVCKIGEVTPLLGAPSCAPCERGRYWSAGTCRGCVPGNFQDHEAATACELCAPGFFVEEPEKSTCNGCMPGSYQEARGSTACILCNVTGFQPKRSQTSCIPCETVIPGSMAAGYGTFDPRMCQCPEGRFISRTEQNDSGVCVPCLDFLTCPGGLDAAGECCEPPTQNARLHVGKPPFPGGPFPFAIWCAESGKCPAGRALGECPEHSVGRACDYCEEGYSYSKSKGKCISCAGQVTFWPLMLTCLVAVFMLFMMVMYAAQEMSVQSQTLMTIALTFSLCANVLQVLGAFRELRLDWPEPLKTLYAVLQVFTFNVDLVNPACVFGNDSPVITYLGALLVHPAFFVALSVTFVILKYAPKPLQRRVSIPQVANAQGLVLLSIYISVSILAVKPWQCERNPDGTSSVVSYRVVTCWVKDGLHGSILAFSAVGIVVYDISFIAVVAWATHVYPIRITQPGGINFLQYFRFLFNRFKPKCYYYGLLYCIRNLLLALIPVAMVNQVSAQVLSTGALVMSTALIQCWIRPWRTTLPNYIDAVSSMGLMLILMGGTVLMDNRTGSSQAIVQGFFMGTLTLVTLVFFGTLLYCLYFVLRPTKPWGVFLSHHKVGAAVLARWFKLHLSTLTKDAIFYDSDNLVQLDKLFEVCAHQCKNVVVLLTRETLRRIWCAGEVVSAIQYKVHIVLVACNDYVPPSDEFINSLDQEWSDYQKMEVTRLGIKIDDIKRAYTSLRTRPVIELNRHAKVSEQARVVEEVFSRCLKLRLTALAFVGQIGHREASRSHSAGHSSGAAAATAPVVLYAEAKEPEDRMVGAVIVVMLQVQLGVAVNLVECADDIYDGGLKVAKYLMVLLTRSVLDSPSAGALMAKAARRANLALLPVTFDPAFTFPAAAWYDSLISGKVYSQDDSRLRGNSLAKVRQAYMKLFSALSLRFTPHGSENLQRTEVSEMLPRFGRILQLQVNKYESEGTEAPEGEGEAVGETIAEVVPSMVDETTRSVSTQAQASGSVRPLPVQEDPGHQPCAPVALHDLVHLVIEDKVLQEINATEDWHRQSL